MKKKAIIIIFLTIVCGGCNVYSGAENATEPNVTSTEISVYSNDSNAQFLDDKDTSDVNVQYENNDIIEQDIEMYNGNWKTNEFAIGKIYDEYIVFLFNDNDITVLASSYSEKIGLMSGMAVDGLYVREKPEYTNSNIFEETYTAEDILALKELIPPDLYEEDFEWVTREGVVEVSEEGGVKTINAYIPTMPEYGYTITIANEKDYEIVFYD